MWILLVIRPRTLLDFIRLCRLYGMTMSDIRMQEAWAMAHWLARAEPPAYGIENDLESSYNLLLWSDSAITRSDVNQPVPEGATRIYAAVPGGAVLGFITRREDGRLTFHEQPVGFIPFSTYNLGTRPVQALCIRYTPPKRKKGEAQKITPLPPRGAALVCHAVRLPEQTFRLVRAGQTAGQDLEPGAPPYGKLVRTKISPPDARLLAVTT